MQSLLTLNTFQPLWNQVGSVTYKFHGGPSWTILITLVYIGQLVSEKNNVLVNIGLNLHNRRKNGQIEKESPAYILNHSLLCSYLKVHLIPTLSVHALAPRILYLLTVAIMDWGWANYIISLLCAVSDHIHDTRVLFFKDNFPTFQPEIDIPCHSQTILFVFLLFCMVFFVSCVCWDF